MPLGWELGSHRDAPLELDLDEVLHGVDQLVHGRDAFGQNHRQVEPHQSRKPAHIKDEDYDAEQEMERKVEEEFLREMSYIDLTADDQIYHQPKEVPARPIRNGSLDATHSSVSTYPLTENIEVKVGGLVELSQPTGQFKASFLKIKSIYMPFTGERNNVIFRGVLCTRTRNLGGQLPRKLNEVCLIYQVDKDDPRDYQIQGTFEVHPDDIAPIRPRHFHMTNRPFPECRFEPGIYTGIEHVEDKGPLICRWQHIIYYADAAKRGASRPCEWAFCHITEDEVQKPRYRIPEKVRLNAWRGGKVLGGSYTPRGILLPPPVHIDDEADTNSTTLHKRVPGQRYLVADSFCGGGGFSRGAQMAGLQIDLAVDHWPRACATYQKNFSRYGVKLYEMDIFDFLNKVEMSHPLDMLHMSPACQPYSPAHTVEGKDDEKNIAVLYSCTELVKKIRPRIFTLEQTFGLLHNRHKCFFNALVQGFSCHGYSVRWKVVNLATLGLSQARRRLIMIGACPGEKLPDFPPATHSSEPVDGLLPYVSVRQVLERIHPGCTLHDLEGVAPRDECPWDADGILPRTITTSGGQNYHYSGTRDLTYREYASLQGFPVWHRFVAPGIKKQIGNAFPPCVVKVLYEWLRRWLENVDGVEPASPTEPEDLVDLTFDDFDDDTSLGGMSSSRLTMRNVKDEVEEQKYLTKDEVQMLDEDEVLALGIKASLQSSQQRIGRHHPKDEAISSHDFQRSTHPKRPGQPADKRDDLEMARRESLQYHFQGQMDEDQALELARRQSLVFVGQRTRQRPIIDLDADDEQTNPMYEGETAPMCVDGGQSRSHDSVTRQTIINQNERGGNVGVSDTIVVEEVSDSDTDSATVLGDNIVVHMDLDD